jgi:hypothetical protein
MLKNKIKNLINKKDKKTRQTQVKLPNLEIRIMQIG